MVGGLSGTNPRSILMVPRASGLLLVACGGLLPLLPARAQEGPPRLDRHGDPLPPGAVARLGTVRFRHGFAVTSLAFSSDGKTVVSGGVGRGVCLWEAASGRERLALGRLGQPPDQVGALAVSPDGQTVAVAGTVLGLYDAATGKPLRQLPGLRRGPAAVAFSPDGSLLAAADDSNVHVWEVATGNMVHVLKGHAAGVQAVAFSPDGKTLASGSQDGSTWLWDPASGKERRRLGREKGDAVHCVLFSPDGKMLAAGSVGPAVRLWDVAAGKAMGALGAGAGVVGRTLAFAADGRTLTAGCADGTVRVWQVATGKEMRRWQACTYGVRALALSPDGKLLATAGLGEGAVRLWDAATGREVGTRGGPRGTVEVVAFTTDGKGLLSCSRDQVARRWDLPAGTVRQSFAVPCPRERLAFALSPDRKTLATGGWDDRTVRLWDLARGKELRQLGAHRGPVRALAFSPDGNLVASAGYDEKVRLWDAVAGKRLHILAGHNGGGVLALAFSPDNKLLASGALTDRAIRLWDVHSGKLVRRWDNPEAYLEDFAFSPDGKLLASASGIDGAAHVWDVATGTEVLRLSGRHGCYRIAFSPDGRLLATGGSEPDNTVRLWEVVTGGEVRRFEGHHSGVTAVAFSADGRLLASGAGDATVLVWDVTGRAPAGKLQGDSLSPAVLRARWADLAETDAGRAHRALWELTAAPADAVRFLKAVLKPVAAPDLERVSRLITDLDDRRFAVREKATRELEKVGDVAAPALRGALAGGPTLEKRQRLERLLAQQDRLTPGPEGLRAARAVAVLEQIGSTEARQILHSLSRGAAGARLTREARASLERLAKRP
jgi:WD40 repeat protein